MALLLEFGGIRKAFSSRNFRIYWVGNFAHNVTVWVNRLAVGWLTWELTHSPTWLGVIAAANMLPIIIVGPFAGVTADRFGHRNQLVVATYIGTVIAVIMALLVAWDAMLIEMLLILNALSGFTRAANVPARQAMIPNLVDRRYMSSAIGINSATFHGGNFLGPALAGVIISAFGIAPAFYAYAAGEFIAATSFMLLHLPRAPRKEGAHPSMLSDFMDGLRYTLGHAGILSLMIISGIVAVFLIPYIDMLPGFADKVFNRGVDGLAYLTASTGAGAMVGGIWIAGRGRTEGLVRILIVTLTLGIAGMIAFVATDILYLSMAALAVVGFALVASQSSGQSLIQNTVASELRARVISFGGVIGVAGPALGAIVIGWAGSHFGLRLPVGIGAVIAFLIFMAVVRKVVRNASEMEAVVPR